jgi:2,3-bisphosphoglycerate-independent phosphoglycerate mutase
MILDGWGIASPSDTNAVYVAKTPVLDELSATFPFTQLGASGEDVGLPEGQMGNSEVGHLNLGAGRIVYQEFTRISKAIRDGSFFSNPVLTEAITRVRERSGSLHLMGLVSDGGVHSHMEHLYALIRMAKEKGCPSIKIHAILDGRDTPPTSGVNYVQQLQRFLRGLGCGEIATVMGRYWGMDRDRRWERVERAYRAVTLGEGRRLSDPVEAVKSAYENGQTDEFIEPCVMVDKGGTPVGLLCDGDAVIFFNFRADRAREITMALTEEDFSEFKRPVVPKLSAYVCMTQYDERFSLPVAFPPESLKGILGEVIAELGLRQLRVAETEKYAHVTYFFNGGEEEPLPLEDRRLIPSPKDVPTYDLKPEMSAPQIADEVCRMMRENYYELIVLNFANGDMVGHTGVMEAAIAACEAVDRCVGKVVRETLDLNGAVLITADHGNAEQMWDYERNEPHTAHTCNPVPCILVDPRNKGRRLRKGILADVAPTLLHLMDIPVPQQMSGVPLIE